MALIEVRDLERTYSDGTRALRGVSFDIKKGEFISIMGPSGSGKSTLLHLLGFLDKHTVGSYRFNGRVMEEYSEDELARVRNRDMGFIFQMFNLLPRATVLENVKLPLLYSDIPESRWDLLARRAVEAVELSHRVDYRAAVLSGGERQRVAIARALINEPEVIFADEPTGNLDTESGEVIMGIIQKLHEEGHTVILVTHETYTAEYSERIINLLDGKLEKDTKVNQRRNSFKK